MTEIRTAIPEDIDKYLDSLVRTGPFASKAELVRAALVAFAKSAGPMATGFDGENIVAPDGRIYQLEYAREGAMRGATGVGISYEGGVLLATQTLSSPLVARVEKISSIGDRVAVLSSGIISDAHMLIQRLREADPKTTDELVHDLVGFYWEHAADKTKRPLCAALLVASALDKEVKLLEFDPSGAWVEMKASAIGAESKRTKEFLEESYRTGSAEEAEKLALQALGKPSDFVVVHVTSQ